MDLTQLTSSGLRQISKLLEQKEKLQSQIAEIDQQLAEFGRAGAQPRPVKNDKRASLPVKARTIPAQATPSKSPRKAKKARRGELKERVIALLKKSGSKGMSVGDLAKELGTTYGNIYAFFQSTAKRIKEIKKAGPGRFSWAE